MRTVGISVCWIDPTFVAEHTRDTKRVGSSLFHGVAWFLTTLANHALSSAKSRMCLSVVAVSIVSLSLLGSGPQHCEPYRHIDKQYVCQF
jgi:hypothetical protein